MQIEQVVPNIAPRGEGDSYDVLAVSYAHLGRRFSVVQFDHQSSRRAEASRQRALYCEEILAQPG